MTVDVFLILVSHFIGDFILQSRNIAERKSTDTAALSWHILIYTWTLSIFGFYKMLTYLPCKNLGPLVLGIAGYVLINGILHFAVDAVTSRLTSYYWSEKNTRAFFITIGADQLIHTLTLIYTLRIFG